MPRSVADADTIQGISASRTPLNNELLALDSNSKFHSYVVLKSINNAISDYSLTIDNYSLLCDATSASFYVYLPTSVGISGKIYLIKKIDSSANTVTIIPSGTETIDGSTSIVQNTADEIITIQSNGVNWIIISRTNTASSAVASVFGRTGNVVATTGDYGVAQITDAAAAGANSDITSLTGLTTPLSKGQGGTGNAVGDATTLNSFSASQTPLASQIPVKSANGELDIGAGTAGFTIQSYAGTGAITIDWTKGNKAILTLSANTTLTFTAPSNACNLMLEVVQNATGGFTLTLPTIKWLDTAVPSLPTTANNLSLIGFFYDGTIYLGVANGIFG